MRLKTLILAATAALALSIPAVPAGPAQPLVMRVVTMDGQTGPAFYSAVEGRYLFAGPVPSRDERVASLSAGMR